jgi:hypothetical protein
MHLPAFVKPSRLKSGAARATSPFKATVCLTLLALAPQVGTRTTPREARQIHRRPLTSSLLMNKQQVVHCASPNGSNRSTPARSAVGAGAGVRTAALAVAGGGRGRGARSAGGRGGGGGAGSSAEPAGPISARAAVLAHAPRHHPHRRARCLRRRCHAACAGARAVHGVGALSYPNPTLPPQEDGRRRNTDAG